jgi:chemosensory pili system protein ChpA (sensor histidine kinase/response regulator)
MPKPLALVVEDDPQLNQIFTLTLFESFEVETISDGTQALERLTEIVPDLVVLDINLPGASGAEILEAIRANARFDSVKVILATASTQQAKELQDKADIVLLKPISPIQLRDLAERLSRVK